MYVCMDTDTCIYRYGFTRVNPKYIDKDTFTYR